MARHLHAASVHDQLGAFLHARVHVAGDLVQVLLGDERPHLGILVGAGVDLQATGALGQTLDQRVGDPANRYRDGYRHAALARRAVSRAGERIHGLIQIRVGHHHQMVLGAAQRLHALARRGAGPVDVLGDWRGADEADRGDARIVQQRVHSHFVAMHDVEHAVGQSGFLEQPGEIDAGRGIALGGFEHEGIAAGDGDREHPHRDHGREVERRDARAYSQWLTHRVAVHTRAHLLAVLAFEQVRDAAGELDHLQAAGHLAARVRHDLAVLAGDQTRQLVVIALDQLLELEHYPCATQRRRCGPRWEGDLGRGHRLPDLFGARERHPARHFAQRGVVNVAITIARAGDFATVDVVMDVLDL